MEDFCVELAGVPVEIRCRFESNRAFLRDYITERDSLLVIEPAEEDLARMQADFDRMDEAAAVRKAKRESR